MATRIIFSCQHSVAYGGVQHAMLDIVRYIDRRLYEPIVLCSPEGELPSLISKEQIQVRTIGAGRYWRYSRTQPLGTVKDLLTVAREIVKLARSEDVRVVHTFDGMVFFAACLAKLQHRELKVIWLDSGFNIYPYHFRVVMHWCFKHAARVAAITSIRVQQLLSEGLDPAKSAVMHNGTDFHLRIPDSDRVRPDVNKPIIRIGIVGRVVPIKNFEMFLHAARLVADKHPHVRFSIVGSRGLLASELEYYDDVQALTSSLRLTERVTFHDPLEDLSPLLNSFDILVSSSHLETFGRTLIEAMALSKPVVATAVGGVPEVVSDGEVGFLVPPGDVKAMAEKISDLVEDCELRQAMGRKGRARVIKYFDVRLITRRWEQLYQEILQG